MIGVLFIFLLYLSGSVPFSYIIPKKLKGVDMRRIGSGNVGATNVIRNLGVKLGILCMILDALKVYIPLMIMQTVLKDYTQKELYLCLAAIAGIIGHDFSIFLKFKGGKGVACTMGTFFALHWLTGALFLMTALSIALSTRIMSLASLTSLTLAVIFVFPITQNWYYFALYLFLCLFSFFQHRKNIVRLLQGKENKF
ncbi:MAG: glycerol-3-phosphate 1-O-acyltransferase PlsY [Thermotogae bacterium]|nr:glycerol-3-phosphate 1-O-acyltransferase PlsY [Thermotogota bacterium]HPH10736.1 glycerol-3-phosphate 1-O-acyltransferase PlsY [Thermotogota bacterium]HPM19728.1 glycerol-3-phosphate 1-O-acyltransferase PlsY [Thermotogota bacterium]